VTRLYYHFFEQPLSSQSLEFFLAKLPLPIAQKIRRYQRWEDGHASLFGKLMLLQALHDFNTNATLWDLKYSSFDKPYLPGMRVAFNISHSGNYTICVMTDEMQTIGVDIEEVKSVELDSFKNIWSDHEWRQINESAGPDAFYDLWTKKEAIIKAEGSGLNIPLDKIEILGSNGRYLDATYSLYAAGISKKYSAHIATPRPVTKIELTNIVDFADTL